MRMELELVMYELFVFDISIKHCILHTIAMECDAIM